MEGELLFNWKRVVNGPLLRELKELPLATALGTSMIMAVFGAPTLLSFWSVPDDLWVWANQELVAPTLQLFSLGTIDNLIVFPVIC